jgi:hypothetical protein
MCVPLVYSNLQGYDTYFKVIIIACIGGIIGLACRGAGCGFRECEIASALLAQRVSCGVVVVGSSVKTCVACRGRVQMACLM